MSQEYVQISKQALRELVRAELDLRALEIGGVDNWEWYSSAHNSFYGQFLRPGDSWTVENHEIAEKRAIDEELISMLHDGTIKIEKLSSQTLDNR